MKILLSIGGASGSIYGVRLFEELIKSHNGQLVRKKISESKTEITFKLPETEENNFFQCGIYLEVLII